MGGRLCQTSIFVHLSKYNGTLNIAYIHEHRVDIHEHRVDIHEHRVDIHKSRLDITRKMVPNFQGKRAHVLFWLIKSSYPA